MNAKQAAEAPLIGNWRHGDGVICCGTLRIAKADFDTNPSDEFKSEVLDWMCATLNASSAIDAATREPFQRVIAWLKEEPRKDTASAFTAGPERELADWIVVMMNAATREREGEIERLIKERNAAREAILTAHYWVSRCKSDDNNGTHAKRILENYMHAVMHTDAAHATPETQGETK